MLRRLAKFSLWSTLALAATLALLAGLWHQGWLKRWAQGKVVQYYLTRVQPHLPFQIEEVDADATWRELLEGRISKLSAVLRWEDWRVRIGGPIEITRPRAAGQTYSVQFITQATVEPAGAPDQRSTALDIDLSLEAASDLSRLVDLEAYARSHRFEWKPLAIDAKHPSVVASWHSNRALLELSIEGLAWTPAPDRNVQAKAASLTVEGPLKLRPLELGPGISARWKGEGAEILLGETYLDLPLQLFPGSATVTLQGTDPVSLVADVGAKKELRLEATPREVKWKQAALPLKEIAPALLAATGNGLGPFSALSALNGFELRAGTLVSEGKATLGADRSVTAVDGVARVRGGAIRVPSAAFAARGVNADLPFSSRRGVQGEVSADEAWFRRLKAKLGPTRVSAEALGANLWAPQGLRVRVAGAEGRGAGEIPLTIAGVPLRLAPVVGKVLTPEEPYDLATALKLEETPVEPVLRALCAAPKSLPPLGVRADFGSLEVSPGAIEIEGEVNASLFGGKIKLDEMAFYDLGSAVPEIDFSLQYEGVQLQQLTDWLNFGEMTGTLQGYARDVTFQSWLPTHFDFSFDVIPPGAWIEVDPKAMRNLVSLFAGDALDELPGAVEGAVKWSFFGWISKRLGGYDLKYFGLSLFGHEGVVLLETHDLPDIYRIMKQHYIFWGHRFKMPLNSSTYPVVMSTSGLAGVVQVAKRRLGQIAKNASSEEKKDDVDPAQCLPPEF